MAKDPAPIYRIKDWDERYENNRTRAYKTLDWVPMPNKMDGDGYTELVEIKDGEDQINGALRFAGWCAIVEIASRCKPRGVLCRDSAGNCPHTADTLSRMSRLPKVVFELVFNRALEIKWIEIINNKNNNMQNAAEILQCSAQNRIEQNRIEQNRIERNTPPLPEKFKNIEGFQEQWNIRLEILEAKKPSNLNIPCIEQDYRKLLEMPDPLKALKFTNEKKAINILWPEENKDHDRQAGVRKAKIL